MIIFFDTKHHVLVGKSIRHWYINKGKGDEDSWYVLFPDSIDYYVNIAVEDKLFRCEKCQSFLKYILTPPNQENFWGCSAHKRTNCTWKMYENDMPKRTNRSTLPTKINL